MQGFLHNLARYTLKYSDKSTATASNKRHKPGKNDKCRAHDSFYFDLRTFVRTAEEFALLRYKFYATKVCNSLPERAINLYHNQAGASKTELAGHSIRVHGLGVI
ncbi:MAG: hypothetical protein CVV42_12745 [Candidatus Riflebacteria bacterium HGW-Riflebacteria-2]|nr:MAG: hypothetical protein CVV42_12745 [Candidatus Riflebacteria bacterium HGW-Riflebacteria-2]